MRDKRVRERESTLQADLTERFSKSRHLEELHKHQSGNKKRQYMDFQSKEFLARQKAEKEAATTCTSMPDDLQLMATISSRLSRDWLYEPSSEVAHLRSESSQTTIELPPCLEGEQRIMRRVEVAVSSVALPSTST
ncbi:hypothetical protein M9H77_21024 [Catharanthus roseus]|uniref:Uncharacterized protein n=1 Tax=Catharanthus roseus TaxID=4058 RepID=A0ACC0AM73_CATRO|nr:hypothetical protein M9H77_21024 [Catharanthus roseus]